MILVRASTPNAFLQQLSVNSGCSLGILHATLWSSEPIAGSALRLYNLTVQFDDGYYADNLLGFSRARWEDLGIDAAWVTSAPPSQRNSDEEEGSMPWYVYVGVGVGAGVIIVLVVMFAIDANKPHPTTPDHEVPMMREMDPKRPLPPASDKPSSDAPPPPRPEGKARRSPGNSAAPERRACRKPGRSGRIRLL